MAPPRLRRGGAGLRALRHGLHDPRDAAVPHLPRSAPAALAAARGLDVCHGRRSARRHDGATANARRATCPTRRRCHDNPCATITIDTFLRNLCIREGIHPSRVFSKVFRLGVKFRTVTNFNEFVASRRVSELADGFKEMSTLQNTRKWVRKERFGLPEYLLRTCPSSLREGRRLKTKFRLGCHDLRSSSC